MSVRRTVNHELQQAMALLIRNQAAFVAQLADSNKRFDETNRRFDETNRKFDETGRRIDEITRRSDKRFARIEEDLKQIKAILARHEKLLQVLPEAIRKKIGFNPN